MHIEFTAATLRHQKDDDASLEILREMTKNGIEFRSFDADSSQISWSSKDGVLFGGYTSLKGVGEIKAKKLVEVGGK